MKSALLYGKNDLRVQDLSIPTINEFEILLKVRSAMICGTDIRMLKNGRSNIDADHPLVMGHEICGVIESVGRSVSHYKKGMRVFVAPNWGCGICDFCIGGKTHLCPDYQAIGIHVHGGFAEYCRVPAAAVLQGNVMQIPDSMSFSEAAVIEPFSCTYSGFERAQIRPGNTVLIFGAGPIGFMHAKLARMAGAAKVMLSDINDSRLSTCTQIDPALIPIKNEIRQEISQLTGGKGADVIITACPVPSVQSLSLELAAINGRVIFFGGLPKESELVPLNGNLIHYRQLIVTGTARSSLSQIRTCIGLVSDGLVRLDDLISHHYHLSEVNQAFMNATKGEGIKHEIVFS